MIGEIPLTRGRAALVDAEDYDFLMQWKWCVITGYAVRTTTRAGGAKPKTILMHRVIVAPPEGFFVDHINCNRLDNRRANLRICTPEENTLNRSPRIRKAERASQFKGFAGARDTANGQRQLAGLPRLVNATQSFSAISSMRSMQPWHMTLPRCVSLASSPISISASCEGAGRATAGSVPAGVNSGAARLISFYGKRGVL